MLKATPMPNSSGSAMMLAKLSGRPTVTQMPSVSRPERKSGASVRSTSPTRRSTTTRQRDRGQRQEAGLDKRVDHGSARFLYRDRGAGRLRRDRLNGGDEAAEHGIV